MLCNGRKINWSDSVGFCRNPTELIFQIYAYHLRSIFNRINKTYNNVILTEKKKGLLSLFILERLVRLLHIVGGAPLWWKYIVLRVSAPTLHLNAIFYETHNWKNNFKKETQLGLFLKHENNLPICFILNTTTCYFPCNFTIPTMRYNII